MNTTEDNIMANLTEISSRTKADKKKLKQEKSEQSDDNTLNRKTANFVHFRRRARERYGLEIDGHNYNALVSLVEAGKSLVSKEETNTRTKHLLKIGKILLPVIYSKTTRNLVTVLPPSHAVELITMMKWS